MEAGAMDTLQLLGSAAGLGLLAGIRLYATVLGLGLAIRFGWLNLAGSHLHVLADGRVLAVAGAAVLIEFLADKVPWLDSLWDSIHTFIRPIGAALVAGGLLAADDPGANLALMLLSGSVAFAGHASKAATRLVVNHSPEPFSNVGLSLLEDVTVPLGLWLVVEYPLIALGIVGAFVLLFLWLSPKVFRLVRLELAAIASVGRKWFGAGGQPPRWPGDMPEAFRPLTPYLSSLPREHAERVAHKYGIPETPLAVRAAATKSIRKLRHSIGYLFLADGELVFVTRRALRFRDHTISLGDVSGLELRKGIFLDRLLVKTADRDYLFDVFLPG
jgi:hypothetical protein